MPRKHEGDESGRIVSSIRQLVRVLRLQDRQSHARHGVTGAQIVVLHALHATEAISLNELAERIQTDQSSASVVVQRLVDSGLVSRTARLDDRRHVDLRLTARGRAFARDNPPPAQEKILKVIAAMAPAERKRFAKLLEAFVAELGSDE